MKKTVVLVLLAAVVLFVAYLVVLISLTPGTNHYKRYKPFVFAVQREFGLDAAKAVRAEYLDFCSFAPIRQCVRLVVTSPLPNQFGISRILSATERVCSSVSSATEAEVGAYAKQLGWVTYSAPDFRKALLSYARCIDGQSAFRPDDAYPPRRDGDFLVITLVSNSL